MEWIENQPVYFGDENTGCSCDEGEFPQLVDNTDTSQVQFAIEPCPGSEQLMTDPTFNEEDTFITNDNWSIADNMLCASGETPKGTSSTLQLDEDKYYQINIIVDSISAGGEIRVSLGQEIIGYITSTGEYTFYGFPVAVFGNTGIALTQVATGTEICISEITVYEVDLNAIIGIYNSAGVYQTGISYETTPDNFVLAQNTVTITIDWAELGISNGCYYLCFLDPCSNTNGQNYPPDITNCTITGSATGWTLLGVAAYDSNNVVMDGSDFGILYQNNVFHNFNSEYCVTIVVSAITGNLTVTFGDNDVAVITTPGTHIITGTPESDLSISLTSLFGNTATIESVCACEILPENYVCDLTSNTFKLGDYSENCTLIINACNNEDGMGFVFDGSGFSPRLRLEAKLKNSKYTNERSVYEDSIGKKSVTYYSRRKQKILAVDLQPEYIHDFLSTLIGFDNVYIENETYFVDDDEYNIEYSDASDDVGSVNLLVSKKTQNVKNTNCTDDENVCTLPPNYLLKADNNSEFITLCDGSLIVING